MLNTELKNEVMYLFQTTKNWVQKNEVQKNEVQHKSSENKLVFINPQKPLDEFSIKQKNYPYTNEIEVIVPLTSFQYKKSFSNKDELIRYLKLHLFN